MKFKIDLLTKWRLAKITKPLFGGNIAVKVAVLKLTFYI
jgi:hypothetical protein